jgi:hypothetical protein
MNFTQIGSDPRLRQTWNQLTSNFESANQSAQAGIFTFSQRYLSPCLAGVGNCLESVTKPCLGDREERLRKRRRREGSDYTFDFYDDWDVDNGGGSRSGLLGWGNDEFDRLLAGSGAINNQPGRERHMNYGSRGANGKVASNRKRTAVLSDDPATDPNVIPSSSAFGFLGRLPFRIGKKGLRYKPSAADLQDNPGSRKGDPESQPLIEGSDDEPPEQSYFSSSRRHKRRARSNTSNTTESESNSDSFRSRGDLFPSEDEADAVPLDDEFALLRTQSSEDVEGRPKRPHGSRSASHAKLSKGTPGSKRSRVSSISMPSPEEIRTSPVLDRSLEDLHQEEAELTAQEEVERKRLAAQLTPKQQGLAVSGVRISGNSDGPG